MAETGRDFLEPLCDDCDIRRLGGPTLVLALHGARLVAGRTGLDPYDASALLETGYGFSPQEATAIVSCVVIGCKIEAATNEGNNESITDNQ